MFLKKQINYFILNKLFVFMHFFNSFNSFSASYSFICFKSDFWVSSHFFRFQTFDPDFALCLKERGRGIDKKNLAF